jgi:hypothetical protein
MISRLKSGISSVVAFMLLATSLFVSLPKAVAWHTGSVSPLPTTVTLLAAGKKSEAMSSFTTGNNTVLSNGTYWYWRDRFSFGFSPNATVNIDASRGYDICGTSYDLNCSPGSSSSRLSWKMSSTTVSPGGRIGNRADITTGTAARLCFTAAAPTYYPSGVQRNVPYSTITGGGWTKSADSYFSSNAYGDQAMGYCFGSSTYVLIASADPSASNVSSFSPRSNSSSNGSITYDLQFVESVSGLTTSDFTVSGSGSGSCVIGAPNGTGANYSITLTSCGVGTTVLTLGANSVTGSTTGPLLAEAAAGVTFVEVATTISLEISDSSSVVYKGVGFRLTATVSQPGKVIFTANGKRIAGCINVDASSTSAVCRWKPTTHGPVVLKASLKPSNSSYTASTSLNVLVATQKRINNR